MHHNNLPKLARLLSIAVLISGLASASPARHATASDQYTMSLPLVLKNAPDDIQPAGPEQTAIDRINYYRGLAGVQLIQLHPALVIAAQNHANYSLLNDGDQSAWVYGPHGEVAGKPGFTGQTAADRMAAAQFPYGPIAEVMNYFDDPVRSVDGWMSTVFHRIGVLYPTSHYAGYGHGRSATEYVDVVDFGSEPTDPIGTPDVVVYPAPSQADVPLYGASETPSALPPDGQYPIGYPITLQPISGTVLSVTQAELHDQSGTLITVYPNPSGCGKVCYAMIPTAGLKPATTYTVQVVGSVDGSGFNRTWSFTTTACMYPGLC